MKGVDDIIDRLYNTKAREVHGLASKDLWLVKAAKKRIPRIHLEHTYMPGISMTHDFMRSLSATQNMGQELYIEGLMRLQFFYEVVHGLRYVYQKRVAKEFKGFPIELPLHTVPQYRHTFTKKHFLSFNHPLSVPSGFRFDPMYQLYDDAPVEFFISALPFRERNMRAMEDINRLYRVEAAYRNVFFDGQRKPVNIWHELRHKILEYSKDVPSLTLWNYESSL